MRAAYIEEVGTPEAIIYGKLPAPVCGPGDVLVEVAATTVNHVDTFVRYRGGHPDDHDYCRRLGAVHTIDYRTPAMAGEVHDLAGSGINLYIDTSGRNDLAQAVEKRCRCGMSMSPATPR